MSVTLYTTQVFTPPLGESTQKGKLSGKLGNVIVTLYDGLEQGVSKTQPIWNAVSATHNITRQVVELCQSDENREVNKFLLQLQQLDAIISTTLDALKGTFDFKQTIRKLIDTFHFGSFSDIKLVTSNFVIELTTYLAKLFTLLTILLEKSATDLLQFPLLIINKTLTLINCLKTLYKFIIEKFRISQLTHAESSNEALKAMLEDIQHEINKIEIENQKILQSSEGHDISEFLLERTKQRLSKRWPESVAEMMLRKIDGKYPAQLLLTEINELEQRSCANLLPADSMNLNKAKEAIYLSAKNWLKELKHEMTNSTTKNLINLLVVLAETTVIIQNLILPGVLPTATVALAFFAQAASFGLMGYEFASSPRCKEGEMKWSEHLLKKWISYEMKNSGHYELIAYKYGFDTSINPETDRDNYIKAFKQYIEDKIHVLTHAEKDFYELHEELVNFDVNKASQKDRLKQKMDKLCQRLVVNSMYSYSINFDDFLNDLQESRSRKALSSRISKDIDKGYRINNRLLKV